MLKIILIYVCAVFITGLFLFLPAGTFDYWEAWVYLGCLYIPMFFASLHFQKNNPEMVKRRMQYKEKEIAQKKIIKFSTLLFIIGFLIPGFDQRFNWSEVPLLLIILSDIIIVLGYLLTIWVLNINSYASRTIKVEEGQKVITTGPYAVVRHPMYVGVIAIFMFTPTALNSLWALIAFIPLPFLIIARILNEEKVLHKELKGYDEYCKRTKYRLIPHIW